MDYTVFLILSPIVSACVIYFLVQCIKRREFLSVGFLSLFITTSLGFLISNIFELIAGTEVYTVFWAKCEHIFVSFIPVTWLLFVFDFTGNHSWKKINRFWPALIPAAMNIGLVLTNDLHQLIWSAVRFIPMGRFLAMRVTHGILYIPLMAMHYALLLLGMGLIIKEFRRSQDIYRWQLSTLIAGMCIAFVFNILYIFQLLPWLKKDYTPIGFAIGSIIFSFGIFKHRLLELVPIPRTKLFDSLSEGIVVIDKWNRIIDINKSASQILGVSDDAIGGSPYGIKLLAPLFEEERGRKQSIQRDTVVRTGPEERHFELKLTNIFDEKNRQIGTVIIIHDITERVRLFEEIKTLRGIIPICAQCKKIRNDSGYWEQVEGYIADHSYAEFSHGLCPECLKKSLEHEDM